MQLAIHISRTSVQLAEVLLDKREIVNQYNFEFIHQSPLAYKKRLTSILEELPLQNEYEEYSLAWATPKQTLAPFKVYNEAGALAIFQLLFGESVSEKTIDFNRLMELSVVSVYEIPDWVKAFFVMKFPTITIRHENAMVLRGLFQGATFKRTIAISINDDYLTINTIFHNELKYSNCFEYQNATDILYHLLFVIQKQEIAMKETTLHFLYHSEKNEATIREVIKSLEEHHYSSKFKEIKQSSSLKLHPLCV